MTLLPITSRCELLVEVTCTHIELPELHIQLPNLIFATIISSLLLYVPDPLVFFIEML
jgi:hypothetical protein